MFRENHLVALDVVFLAVVIICVARAIYYQARVILKVIRPFRREDDVQLGPLTFMGPAKGQRLYDFAHTPDPTGLRSRRAWSWAIAVCAAIVFLTWVGIIRDLVTA